MSRGPHPYLSDEERLLRSRAGRIYRRALRHGHLVPQPCEVCDKTPTHGHHAYGYDEPLAVMWLCASHHGMAHLSEQQRRFRESYDQALSTGSRA